MVAEHTHLASWPSLRCVLALVVGLSKRRDLTSVAIAGDMSEAFANRANVLVNHLMLVLRHGCVVFKEVVELGVLTRLLLSHCRLVLKLLQAKVLLISGALRVLLHLVNVL